MTRTPRVHSYAPLAAHLEGDQARHARASLGISGATLDRWRAEGLTDAEADRAATRLGLNPRSLWPGWEDAGATVVPDWLWDAVPATAVAVWAALARLAGLDGAHATAVTVSVDELAGEALISYRHAKRCLRQLEIAGAVAVERRPLAASTYTLSPGGHDGPRGDMSTTPGKVAS